MGPSHNRVRLGITKTGSARFGAHMESFDAAVLPRSKIQRTKRGGNTPPLHSRRVDQPTPLLSLLCGGGKDKSSYEKISRSTGKKEGVSLSRGKPGRKGQSSEILVARKISRPEDFLSNLNMGRKDAHRKNPTAKTCGRRGGKSMFEDSREQKKNGKRVSTILRKETRPKKEGNWGVGRAYKQSGEGIRGFSAFLPDGCLKWEKRGGTRY